MLGAGDAVRDGVRGAASRDGVSGNAGGSRDLPPPDVGPGCAAQFESSFSARHPPSCQSLSSPKNSVRHRDGPGWAREGARSRCPGSARPRAAAALRSGSRSHRRRSSASRSPSPSSTSFALFIPANLIIIVIIIIKCLYAPMEILLTNTCTSHPAGQVYSAGGKYNTFPIE